MPQAEKAKDGAPHRWDLGSPPQWAALLEGMEIEPDLQTEAQA